MLINKLELIKIFKIRVILFKITIKYHIPIFWFSLWIKKLLKAVCPASLKKIIVNKWIINLLWVLVY